MIKTTRVFCCEEIKRQTMKIWLHYSLFLVKMQKIGFRGILLYVITSGFPLLRDSWISLWECTFLLLRPPSSVRPSNSLAYRLNSRQPPPPQSFSFTHPTTTTTLTSHSQTKLRCHVMLRFEYSERMRCWIFEPYAMLYCVSNIRKIAAIPCLVSNIRNITWHRILT
jgi:hypothetical protein